MSAVAGSFYLFSTAAFCLFCLAICVRLVRLSMRTGGRPERLLGLALGMTGGVGYGLLIVVSLATRARAGETSLLFTALGMLGKAVHDVGVVLMLAFILSVFRPSERWARVLAAAMTLTLAVGYVGNALTGGFSGTQRLGFWYWVGFSVIGTYPMWGAAEAFRYHQLMRKRQALGLADPVVVNRFLMWGVASLFAVAAIWTVTLPGLLGVFGLPLETQLRWSPFVLSLTGIWGIGAIASYWLTFFAPRWYLARIAAPSAG